MHAPGETETPLLAALVAVMRQRRSVRAYLPERIPDSVLNDCFDLAILAPTSHNLECWQMIEVRDTARLAAVVAMVIAAGRGAVGGVIPQIRFGREHYIQCA